jgi:hypothetical protein
MREPAQAERPGALRRLATVLRDILDDAGTLLLDLLSGLLDHGAKNIVAIPVIIVVIFASDFGPLLAATLLLGVICFGVIRYRHRS